MKLFLPTENRKSCLFLSLPSQHPATQFMFDACDIPIWVQESVQNERIEFPVNYSLMIGSRNMKYLFKFIIWPGWFSKKKYFLFPICLWWNGFMDQSVRCKTSSLAWGFVQLMRLYWYLCTRIAPHNTGTISMNEVIGFQMNVYIERGNKCQIWSPNRSSELEKLTWVKPTAVCPP